MYFETRTEYMGNRVVRTIPSSENKLVRVIFSDEKMKKPFFCDNEAEIAYIRQKLFNGITIWNRKFVFFGYTNSQIKNNSVWFLEANSLEDSEREIKKFGYFKDELVSKNGARRGQCFSSTKVAFTLTPETMVKAIDDIHGKCQNPKCYDCTNNKPCSKRCFSDGIGKISLKLAEYSSASFGIGYCSSFQIRMGGIKGMEIILLLTTLNAPGKIFLDLQNQMLEEMKILLRNSKSLFLEQLDYLEDIPFLCAVCIKLKANKFDLNRALFIKTLCLMQAAQTILLLKEKARILDPCSCRLRGVLDETNSLKPNEVFVQICSEKNMLSPEGLPLKPTENCYRKYFTIINGEVVVTKNPCLHPGDVRKLTAVNCDKLLHLVNVVVFSSQIPETVKDVPKEMPVPQQIGGGDLDGDEFFVS